MKTNNKTVRMGVFETNSSSTNSLSVQTKGSKNNKEVKPLVENNVLYPRRLSSYGFEYGETYGICCGTKDEKAAIVAHWINSYHYDLGDDEIKDHTDYLANKLGYNSIDWEGSKSYDFSPSSEYGDDYLTLETIKGEEGEELECIINNNIAQLDKCIEYILDDTKEIIDVTSPM